MGEKIDSLPVTSLFFGGGTPTLVPARELESVLETIDKSFTLAADAEVTIEANPGTVSPSLLGDLRAMGINRLSLGIQSFDDQVLKRLGRGHTALQGLEACNWARAQGFSNLSLDLMFAVPGQNLESWEETLAITTELAPEHVSAYSLIVEEDTPYGQWCQQGLLDVPSEDLWADMMELTEARLASAGLERYEISNYARRGFESRHNQIYWRNGPYLGFGAGAHSYWQQRRWANTSDVTRYIRDFAVTGAPVAGEETLDLPGQMGETVMLGLRLLRGVDLAEFRRRFGRGLVGGLCRDGGGVSGVGVG